MKPSRGQAYPAASALPTRASSAEAQPDEHAATALDRPTLSEETLAFWSAPKPLPDAARRASAHAAKRPAPKLAAWVALALLGIASGIAGAFVGAWLALEGG